MNNNLKSLSNHKLKITGIVIAVIIVIITTQYKKLDFFETKVQNIKDKNITAKKQIIRPVKVITLTLFDGKTSSSYPGIISSAKQVQLAFKNIGGRIVNFPAEGMEGQLVKSGDLLAQLEKRDFIVSLKKILAQKRKARAAYELAQTEYRREQRIYFADQGATSQSAIVNLKKQMEMGKADIDALKASEEEVKIQLDETELIAPFTGMIAKTFVHKYQIVQPLQAIVSLQDINNLEIHVDLPEKFMQRIKQLKKGQYFGEAEFKNLKMKKRYPLKFKEYVLEADKNTQTFQVVLSLKQPREIRVLPGMTAQIHFEDKTDISRFYLLPNQAIVAGNSNDFYVFRFDRKQGKAIKSPVVLGEFRKNGKVEVIQGIKAGDSIIVTGVTKLREGMKVRVWNTEDLN